MKLNYLIVDTSKNRYLYDGITSKIVVANAKMMEALKYIEKQESLENVIDTQDKEIIKYYGLLKDMINKGMFMKSEESTIRNEIDYTASSHMSLIVVLTGKCNLRCEYCVYNDKYPHEIGYEEKDMQFETAQKAINQYFKFYKMKRKRGFYKKPSILFYGGEPLIMMGLIKEIVAYTEEISFDCDFYMTTNGLLLNEEYAEYFVKKNFRITFSLDGNMWNHDRNRVDLNGNPTFSRVLDNIIKFEKIKISEGKRDLITSFNCCYDDYTDLEECIDTFVKYADYIRPFYVVYSNISPYDTTYYSWVNELAIKNGWKKGTLLESYARIKDKFVKGLYKTDDEKAAIQNLMLSIYAMDIRSVGGVESTLNNCCVPMSKLAVYPDGTYTVCEKMNKKLPIGNAHKGIDHKKLNYVTSMMEKVFSEGKCANCVYKKLCNSCFQFLSEDGDISEEFCKRSKITINQQLKDYCELREEYPEIMNRFQPDRKSMELINILS